MTLPFDHLRIVDFSQGVAGPMATMLFADFGAEVIKVEPPAGDRMKDAPGYLCWNRNKSVVTLDTQTFDGLQAAKRLVASADVVVFDTPPGGLERLGLDGATLVAAHPALLHVWMPPYAPAGRWTALPNDELLLSAVTGVAHLQSSFEDQPVALVTPQISYGHATIAANAIAAGLWERDRSGQGQALVVSGLHAVSAIQGSGHSMTGGAIRISRSSRGGIANYRLYECADGEWFFLGCLTSQFFLKCLDAIGMMDLMTLPGVDGEFTNILANPAVNVAMQDALDVVFLTQPRQHWLDLLGAAGVPKGPAGRREDWFRGETVAANAMRLAFDHETLGRVEIPGVPLTLPATPGAVRHLPRKATLDSLPPRETPALVASSAATTAPLAGVRIVDIGAFIAGTFAPAVLANFGAEVIKVEPLGGDPFRPYGLAFVGHNLGKRSLALDLKHPQGKAAFFDLVRQADVVLDNYRLGVRERLGVDYATLAAINPRIITCSVTGYGVAGELAADPGFDPLMQARSGMMWAQGGRDEPVFHQIAVNDTATAMIAAFGIQAALHARLKTGLGQEVTTCLANQSVLFQSGEVTWYEGRPASPTGGRDFIGESALRRFYRCADGWLCLACTTPSHFHQTCIALGRPDLAARTIAERALHEPNDGPLATALAEILAAMPRAEAVDRLRSRDVPAAPSLAPAEIFTDPWLHQNGHFQTINYPLFGDVQTIRSYGAFSRSPSGFAYGTPMTGQHSAEILREFGFSEERIVGLIAEGVVGAA